ncbi:MAG: hypothetical protein KGL53_15010 [Elusimicrobia bacterium]|nr:hypothetical protein [Elusimicrobiota bacterium]
MLYLRFLTFMAVGLFGVSLILVTLFDTLFVDWDVVGDAKVAARHWARKQRQRYVLLEDQNVRSARLAARLAQEGRNPMEALPLPRPRTIVAPAEVKLPPLPDRTLTPVA